MDSQTLSSQTIQRARATAIAFINFFVVLGGFILQPIFGAGHDLTSESGRYTADDYQMALILMPISLIFGTILCIWIRDTVKDS